jgi:hypothetical protein
MKYLDILKARHKAFMRETRLKHKRDMWRIRQRHMEDMCLIGAGRKLEVQGDDTTYDVQIRR